MPACDGVKFGTVYELCYVWSSVVEQSRGRWSRVAWDEDAGRSSME